MRTLLKTQKFDIHHKIPLFTASVPLRCIPLQMALSGIVLKAVHQFPNVDTDVGFVFVDTQFLTDITTEMIMSFQLDILPNLFSAQANGVQTEIVQF